MGDGWHTFRHSVGILLAEIGEHQLTIRDYLRHSNFHVEQVPAGDIEDQTIGARQIGRRHFSDGYFAQDNLIQ